MPEPRFKPAKGDVLFFKRKGFRSKGSVMVQRFVDPAAAGADRSFDHAAIVIDEFFALEAVPASRIRNGDAEGDRSSAETGIWTKVPLGEGVRIVPLGDQIADINKDRGAFRVLRPAILPTAGMELLGTASPEVRRLLGSEYSVELLTEAALRISPDRAERVSQRLRLTSHPTDLATRIGMTEEIRQSMVEEFPDLALPDVARKFFCSQLVVSCLEFTGLLGQRELSDMTTPTGLFQSLQQLGWHDVTMQSYDAESIRHHLVDMQSHLASFCMLHMQVAPLMSNNDAVLLQGEILRADFQRFLKETENG